MIHPAVKHAFKIHGIIPWGPHPRSMSSFPNDTALQNIAMRQKHFGVANHNQVLTAPTIFFWSTTVSIAEGLQISCDTDVSPRLWLASPKCFGPLLVRVVRCRLHKNNLSNGCYSMRWWIIIKRIMFMLVVPAWYFNLQPSLLFPLF